MTKRTQRSKILFTVDSFGVAAVVTATLTLATVKAPARSQSFHTARFDTWALSIVFGYEIENESICQSRTSVGNVLARLLSLSTVDQIKSFMQRSLHSTLSHKSKSNIQQAVQQSTTKSNKWS